MCDSRDRQIAANMTALAHRLGQRDRQIAALESMNRVLLAMLDTRHWGHPRPRAPHSCTDALLHWAMNEPGEVGIERRN